MSDSVELFKGVTAERYAPMQRTVMDSLKERDEVAEALKRREAERVVYFHTDHFEPWRGAVGSRQLEQVELFAEQTSRLPYSRKLSLFYNVAIPGVKSADAARTDLTRLDGDEIAFLATPPEKTRLGQRMMQTLRDAGHEIHLHIHHEGFTTNDFRPTEDYVAIQDWLRGASTPELDHRRFELYLQLSLDEARKQIGTELKRWGFVHGSWALNGSDPTICRLDNEISIMAKHGCCGDFTFPAPRAGVNPKRTEPYTIIPCKGPRCYDTEAAQPLSVSEHPESLNDPARFLIWAAAIDPRYCSLDSLSTRARLVLADMKDILLNWASYSPMIGSTIYIKTHAHSMSMGNFEALWQPQIPHIRSEVQRGFSVLMSACEKARVPLVFLTANEVVEEIRHAPARRQTTGITPRPLITGKPSSLSRPTEVATWRKVRRRARSAASRLWNAVIR